MSSGRNGKNGDPPEMPQDDAEPVSQEPVREAGLAEAQPTREELEALRRECSELKEALLRRRAEFENFKKRAERDQRQLADDVAGEIFRRLVDTVDNLERALAATGGEQGLRQGVELTLRDLQSVLEAHDVAVVDPAGERFDPVRHQALLHEHVPGFDEGTVAEVFRKGYTYRDRLLRPALVKVASGDAQGGGETGEPGGGDAI